MRRTCYDFYSTHSSYGWNIKKPKNNSLSLSVCLFLSVSVCFCLLCLCGLDWFLIWSVSLLCCYDDGNRIKCVHLPGEKVDWVLRPTAAISSVAISPISDSHAASFRRKSHAMSPASSLKNPRASPQASQTSPKNPTACQKISKNPQES